MGKVFLILMIFSVTHARDPDMLPRDYEYGERQTVGGSKWTGGDTFIAIALPIAAVMVLALPIIFDGEHERWPVYKFRLHLLSNVNKTGDLFTKFPTRQLCGSY